MRKTVEEGQMKGIGYQLTLKWHNQAAWIEKGYFGEVVIGESSLFRAVLKNVSNGEYLEVDSESTWEKVRVKNQGNTRVFYFLNPEGIEELMFVIKGVNEERGISWSVEVINDNKAWSVMEVTYPTPSMAAEYFDLFLPFGSGIVIQNAGKRQYEKLARYPGGIGSSACMQYFAVYGKQSGLYIGVEDEEGAVKAFTITTGADQASLTASFYGVNGSQPANSFCAFGHCRWQYIEGDWYDAAMIYADFVRTKAKWLPKIAKDGRTDTPQRFKEVPFWVSDYIPNIPSQGVNRPMSISAGSDIYDKNYWIDAVIELQEKLQVPIAYHVYNWHQIPFNIEYPHFMPAKQEFIQGAKKLREHSIYILPYINSVSWEMHDAEMGHEINFDNVGKRGAVIKEDGSFSVEHYPQTTLKGENSLLAHMCPSFDGWHTIIAELSEQMEKELPIDGIYYDQIAATPTVPCYNVEHNHLPGGGSYWANGYQRLMEKINAKKPENSFYFTECNAETYAKSFDGFLTWMWVQNGQVPAFPAVYAGYVEMLGRVTIGKKKEDYEFFKYSTAQSVLYGQQLGWCKADVVYDEKRLAFLTKMVKLRYDYTQLFHCADMLRPPKVETSIHARVTTPALGFKDDIVMDQILAGAWRYRNKEKLVLFCINVAEEKGEYKLTFSAEEYGLDEYELPEEFVVTGNQCKVAGTITPEGYKVWQLTKLDKREEISCAK